MSFDILFWNWNVCNDKTLACKKKRTEKTIKRIETGADGTYFELLYSSSKFAKEKGNKKEMWNEY